MEVVVKLREVRSGWCARARAHITLAATLAALGVTFGGWQLATAPAALAYGAGDFSNCTSVYLPSLGGCTNPTYHVFYEVQSWNSDDKGVGNCAAVADDGSGAYWEDYACTNDGSGYNAALCTSCDGDGGYGSIGDNSIYGSLFTGWGEWT